MNGVFESPGKYMSSSRLRDRHVLDIAAPIVGDFGPVPAVLVRGLARRLLTSGRPACDPRADVRETEVAALIWAETGLRVAAPRFPPDFDPPRRPERGDQVAATPTESGRARVRIAWIVPPSGVARLSVACG